MCEDSAAAAALAFRNLCSDCKKELRRYIDGLFQIYERAVSGEGTFKVSAEDSLHLVEALSMVITELNSENAKKALEAICLPAVSPLQVAQISNVLFTLFKMTKLINVVT
nr:transportin MOS14 isoform X2 [Ipomoea batatas]GMC69756.1 transportin MOS14 isoform X2 [Ipomoea batatas]